MYEIKNKRFRRTTVALPGKGIILQPRNKQGSTAVILDRERKDAVIKGLEKQGYISVTPLPENKQPKESTVAPDQKELQRIDNTLAAEESAKERNSLKPKKKPARKRRSKKETD